MPSPDQPLDDDESTHAARRARLARGYRRAARRALAFARRYRREDGAPGGERETQCLEQARAWRRAAHDVRAGRLVATPARPGLARARGLVVTAGERAG